ncbi:YihY/virulence factor BrkB family protein [Agromyces atrinae]|uniref:Membrane protein n=1 Tax=Agromyces atrinae TaxID=592376 RepID=A0A4Q2M3K9_9MICO|nr:YihY/virulence factor BrkB family protein [Agromyces atrinae]NYD66251.1 membrane protein [Agromyces atrinae]RXZ86584.1 YihY/virulence factor BrkB family protein [Agromyces atrinae]
MNDTPGPTRPTQLRRETWRHIIVRTARRFGFDDLPDAAASLTYYAVLAIFPALIAIVAGFVVFSDEGVAIDAVLARFEEVFPGVSTENVRGALDELASQAGWYALIVGALVTVWAVSRYVGAFSRTLNRIYEIDEGRRFPRLKPEQLAVSLAIILLWALIACCVIIAGPTADDVAAAWGIGEPWLMVWGILRWPLAVALAVVLIGMLYYATPNVHQRRFRWLSLGAGIALLVLVASSAGFFLYVANFAQYDRIYRSLAGALIFLIWVWIANLAVLLGAEFDSEVERGRQLQAGIAAEERLVMEPRDTALSDIRAERIRREVDDARDIRYRSAPRGTL